MDKLPAYFMHDQPARCPMCGKRTEWAGENPQRCICVCGFTFLVEEDEDSHREVKHGLVERCADWPYSTFHRFVADGRLPVDWGVSTGSEASYGERE